MSAISDNLHRVNDAIATACRKAGRSPDEVRLMAVSKTHPVDCLLEAVAAGHRLFGENRVQEFSEKSSHLGDIQNIEVHLIGHLQTNKCSRAAEMFLGIDTVDSLRVAQRLHSAAKTLGRVLPVLLEIKLSPEEAKEGLLPESRELDDLLHHLVDLRDHLPLRGLMTVAPIADDPAIAQNCFRQLRRQRDTLAAQHPDLGFEELSMGMSGDFEAAIAEGSTVVRIGTAIFGARPKQDPAL
jgi:pyridoxal phosphate enzyme (YggS family)